MKKVLLVVGNTKCNYIQYKLFQKNEVKFENIPKIIVC